MPTRMTTTPIAFEAVSDSSRKKYPAENEACVACSDEGGDARSRFIAPKREQRGQETEHVQHEQLLLLGVMGEYTARIHYEVKGRPLYVFSEAHGLLGPRTARAIEVPASTPEVP
jgi:hypothetical protein